MFKYLRAYWPLAINLAIQVFVVISAHGHVIWWGWIAWGVVDLVMLWTGRLHYQSNARISAILDEIKRNNDNREERLRRWRDGI